MAKRGRTAKYDGRKFNDCHCSGGLRGVKLGFDSYGKLVLKRKERKYKKSNQ